MECQGSSNVNIPIFMFEARGGGRKLVKRQREAGMFICLKQRKNAARAGILVMEVFPLLMLNLLLLLGLVLVVAVAVLAVALHMVLFLWLKLIISSRL